MHSEIIRVKTPMISSIKKLKMFDIVNSRPYTYISFSASLIIDSRTKKSAMIVLNFVIMVITSFSSIIEDLIVIFNMKCVNGNLSA